MLMIRLARFGAKKKPTYRVVVIEKERARDSSAVEVVGHYNPVTQPALVQLKHDRIEHWMKSGRAAFRHRGAAAEDQPGSGGRPVAEPAAYSVPIDGCRSPARLSSMGVMMRQQRSRDGEG